MLVAGITRTEDVARFITQEPLIDTKPSQDGISALSEIIAVYFGVGLCNGAPLLSTDVPVDVLSMILASEQIGAPKHILVADTHAITNGFDPEAVYRRAGHYQEK